MKKISIVGIGLSAETMTFEAKTAITEVELVFAAPRMLEICSAMEKDCAPIYLPEDVSTAVAASTAQSFAVLVSGDVGFYSAARGLSKALAAYELRFIPGISTVNAFFSKLGLPWQDAAFVSAHGREANLVDTVRRSRLSFCLTGKNCSEIAEAMDNAGFGDMITHVGENLGAEDERIYVTKAKALGTCPSLTVLLFVNEAFDDRCRIGIADHLFKRIEKVPMTKSEVRALIMAKLQLRPTDISWDIGAGTGSVTVEMGLASYKGYVHAIERKVAAAELIEENCRNFHLGNVSVHAGSAPEALAALPAPDKVFIGGSGGELKEIIKLALSKNPAVRLVITAIALETVQTTMSVLKEVGLDAEIVQINCARARVVGGLHLMEAQNPVFVLSAGGEI